MPDEDLLRHTGVMDSRGGLVLIRKRSYPSNLEQAKCNIRQQYCKGRDDKEQQVRRVRGLTATIKASLWRPKSERLRKKYSVDLPFVFVSYRCCRLLIPFSAFPRGPWYCAFSTQKAQVVSLWQEKTEQQGSRLCGGRGVWPTAYRGQI